MSGRVAGEGDFRRQLAEEELAKREEDKKAQQRDERLTSKGQEDIEEAKANEGILEPTEETYYLKERRYR